MGARVDREDSEAFLLRYKLRGRKEEKETKTPENEGVPVGGHVLRDVQAERAGKKIKVRKNQ